MMHTIGADTDYAREMDLDDILRGRIDLLLLMARDYLQGTTLGKCQCGTIEKNALHVELECSSLVQIIEKEPIVNHPYITIDFCHCLKRLAGMMKSVAQGHAVDQTRRKAIHDYAEAIAEAIYEGHQMNAVVIEDGLNLLLMRLLAVI